MASVIVGATVAIPAEKAVVDMSGTAGADAWLRLAEGGPGHGDGGAAEIEEPEEEEDLDVLLTALAALSCCGSSVVNHGNDAAVTLWAGLQQMKVPWVRFRTAEARLRARTIEALARVRHHDPAQLSQWQADTTRPPWREELPSLVEKRWLEQAESIDQAAVAEGQHAVDLLCSLDCEPSLCSTDLCWHCWHKEECGGCPPQLSELLRHARAMSAQAAPAHQARLIEQQWGYLAELASRVSCIVQEAGTSQRTRVLVLGGVGVAAVAACRAGAEAAVLWQPQAELAAVARRVVALNGMTAKIAIAEELAGDALAAAAATAHIVALEGLEPDGLFGCGALAQFHQLAKAVAVAKKDHARGKESGEFKVAPAVLPSVISCCVALAESRLTSATGTDVCLEPFADAYGGLAPLPRAAEVEEEDESVGINGNNVRQDHAFGAGKSNSSIVRPRLLSNYVPVFKLELAEMLAATWRQASMEASKALTSVLTQGTSSLLLSATRAGRPDAFLARFQTLLCRDGGVCDEREGAWWTLDSLFSLPARLKEVRCDAAVEVQARWNPHRLWFEVTDSSLFAAPPLARVHLLEWYSEMMNDKPRNTAFAAAISSAVRARREKGSCRVVDLGCGAGVLSVLASKEGADEVVGVEITPHLARCAQRVTASQTGGAANGRAVSVMCADLRTVAFDDDEHRFDVVVSELLDAGGLGERIVQFMRHAKSHLLRSDGDVVPRRLRIHAVLADVRLPAVAGVEVGLPLEPFWLPARAASGEWLGMDLDIGAQFTAASEPLEVFALDFSGPQASLASALQERDLSFNLLRNSSSNQVTHRCNAVVWWFEADVGGDAPILSSAPACFRHPEASATHWVQAVAGLGPWTLDAREARAVCMRLRTDGVHLTWTPRGLEPLSTPSLLADAEEHEEAQGRVSRSAQPRFPLLPLPEVEQTPHSTPALEVEAWRNARQENAEGLRSLRTDADKAGDFARLHALQAAVLHLAAQPGFFGLAAIPEAISPLLKDFFP